MCQNVGPKQRRSPQIPSAVLPVRYENVISDNNERADKSNIYDISYRTINDIAVV